MLASLWYILFILYYLIYIILSYLWYIFMDRKARIDILKGHIQVNVNKIGLEDNYIFSQDNNTKHDVYKFRYDVR